MSELAQRSVTAFFIGAVSLAAMYLSPWTWLGWLLILHAIAVIEYHKLAGSPSSIFPILFSVVTTGWLGYAGYEALQHHEWYYTLFALPFLIVTCLSFTFFTRREPSTVLSGTMPFLSGIGYITLPLSSGMLFLLDEYNFRLILIPVILIWINDSGAYLIGAKWGQKKIVPAISPGKSLEGTIGGMVLSVLCIPVLMYFLPDIPEGYIWMLGFMVPFFALAGDLWESAVKRQAGVKDSGHLLPGHGGILDRYDSFIFVLPLSLMAYFIFVA